MKALVVYDSQYGNTEKIARVIARSIGARVTIASLVTPQDFIGIDLLVIGSPTQGGKPTLPIQQFINSLPASSLRDINVAAFDTRFLEQELTWPLKILVRTVGYAAPKIAKELTSKGGSLVVPPEGFIVSNTQGPLIKGELERARSWLDR